MLNLGVLDGFWVEGYDGPNGWAIGSPEKGPLDPEARDVADADSLYRLLKAGVVPSTMRVVLRDCLTAGIESPGALSIR